MRKLAALFWRWYDWLFPLRPVPLEDVENIKDAIERGAEAERVLGNRVLKAAMKELEGEIVRQWRESGLADEAKREWLWLKLRTLDDLPGVLRAWVQDGKVEKDRQELEALAEKQGKYR